MGSVKSSASSRAKRKIRIRKKIFGTLNRPRLSVFRSSKYIYAQIIDDSAQKTLVTCSSAEKVLKTKLKSAASLEAAKAVGAQIAEKALEKKIKTVVFDRGGFIFHGRIKALAEGAREKGLSF